MLFVAPVNDNRWIYAMHGLEKPMEFVPAGGVMAGSVATLAILWVSLQTMGLLGWSHSMEPYKLPVSLQNYLTSYTGLPSTDTSPEGIVDTGLFQNRRFPRILGSSLNESVDYAKTLVDRMGTLERNIANAGVQFDADSASSKQYVDSYPSDDAFEKSVDAILAGKASLHLLHQNCRRFGLSSDDCARYITTLKLEGTPLGDTCMASHVANCNLRAKYRSIDGSCNNIDNPSWGKAMTAYTRILFPQYFDGEDPSYKATHGHHSRSSRCTRLSGPPIPFVIELTQLAGYIFPSHSSKFVHTSNEIVVTSFNTNFSFG